MTTKSAFVYCSSPFVEDLHLIRQTRRDQPQSSRDLTLAIRPRLTPQYTYEVQHHCTPLDLRFPQTPRVPSPCFLQLPTCPRASAGFHLLCIFIFHQVTRRTNFEQLSKWVVRGAGGLS